MSELVSILIPAYNAERWLGQTVESCLAQTWSPVEVIIVDDGSRDATFEIARRFESGRVKAVTQPNAGAPVARNAALQLAQGSFIQWMDADDLLHPDKIARQMEAARQLADPFTVLSGPFGPFYHRPEKAKFVRTSLWRDLTPLDYFLIRFNENLHFQTDAWLVSRDLTEAAGPWSDIGSPDDDGEYFCRVVAHSRGVKFVDEARTYYRSGVTGSLHGAHSRRALHCLLTSKLKCISHLLSLEDSERTRQASVRLLRDWLPSFHPEHPDLVELARRRARELGGELQLPQIRSRYRPVEWLLGARATAALTRRVRNGRTQLRAACDRGLYNLQPQRKRSLH